MPKESSFDVVCEPNWAEVTNAVDQVRRETRQRYDFRGHEVIVDWDAAAKTVWLDAPAGMVMDALATVLNEKMAKRGVDLAYLDYEPVVLGGKDRARRAIRIRHGLDPATAKLIQKAIKALPLKVDVQIQGDAVRVSGKSKDDLQRVIVWMDQQDFGLKLTATNYRS